MSGKLIRTAEIVALACALLAVFTLAANAEQPPPDPSPPQPPPVKSPVGFIKGYTWGWNSQRGDYLTEMAAESMTRLAETGTDWIALAYMCHMPAWNKPEIHWGQADPKMVSDDEIRHAIQMARKHNLKVVLKPVVDLAPGGPPDKWRGVIDFTTADGKPDEQKWQQWWTQYEAYVVHHAKNAAETKCEMFSIGCEMRSTERFEPQWRQLIRKVREVYKGPLVYNGMFETMWFVEWWDAVDIVGLSAYSWNPDQKDSTLETQMAYWTTRRDNLRLFVKKYQRPVFFIEVGCRSARGASAASGDFTNWEWPWDGDEQARFYEAIFRVFWDEPWFIGMTWWDWKVKLYKKEDADKNKEFCIYAKPAEKVLRTWYAKERK